MRVCHAQLGKGGPEAPPLHPPLCWGWCVSAPEQRRRSGSQTRQRRYRIAVAMTETEHAAFMAKVDEAGLPAAAFARLALLGEAGPRVRRRRTSGADARLLAQVLAQLGRVGGNVNQIARALNRGRSVEPFEIDHAAREVRELVGEIMRALGRAYDCESGEEPERGGAVPASVADGPERAG